MLPQVDIDRESSKPLHRQLAHQLRDLVRGGGLPPGTRLPPSRRFARDLDVSRTVVVRAYEQLQAEGYLVAQVGSGTRVDPHLPERLLRPSVGREVPPEPRGGTGTPGSSVSRPPHPEDPPRPLDPGRVAVEFFPLKEWEQAGRAVSDRLAAVISSYGDPAGYRPLREEIAGYLALRRGIACSADHVLVTAGAVDAVDRISRVLLGPGDTVSLEDPSYVPARGVLERSGARLRPVPVDRDGMDVEALREAPASVVYATPSRNYPLGVALATERRRRLLDLVEEEGLWLIEDDYDVDFWHEGRPLPALKASDPGGRILYVGTFSRVLAPGLRVGYVVLPPSLVDRFLERDVSELSPPHPLQMTLAEFMREGSFQRHVAEVSGGYRRRRNALLEALRAELGEDVDLWYGPAGLEVTLRLPPGVDDREVRSRLSEEGIGSHPLSAHYAGQPRRPGLVLGCASTSPLRIWITVARLAEVVRPLL